MENEQNTNETAPTDAKTRLKKANPRDSATFWASELESSEKFLRKFHKQGEKVINRYLDDRGDTTTAGGNAFRLNLFNSNIRTMMDMLYSNLPKVEASRTHADSSDDVARVAANTIERLINTDIADHPKDYDSVLRSCLQDRLLPGLGVARIRYEFDEEEFQVPPRLDPFGNVIAPAYTDVKIVNEQAPVDYFHWQDVRWGWARCFSEVPWVGFRSYLSKDEAADRFGKENARQLEYKKQKVSDNTRGETRPEDDAPWSKAEVWEIWDKTLKQTVWYSPGAPKLLDKRPDPLQLKNFYPCPEFLIANATTSLYRPVSDYHMCQDLYNEIDTLQVRISTLTTAVKVVGVYDSSSDGIKRMLSEGFENDLIPVDSWAMFAETGGLKGAIDWLPIMDVVNALDKLRQLRDETIGLLQRISGMADVMQGGLQNQYEGVGQTQMKAQFGSVRVQALQDCFANFASDLLQLKAEVICKHFQPESIAKYSNMQFSFDAELLPQAIQLLKQPEMAHVRIKVRPEQVAMADYAQLKIERTEFLNAMATFMQSAAPMLQQEPQSMPLLLQMLQWTMSGFKGSAEIEGVLDTAIEQAQQKAQQAAENPPEDPAAKEAAAKAAEAQQKLQGEMQKIQAKAQADLQMRQADMQADIQTENARLQAKLQEITANHQANMAEIEAKMRADVVSEQAQMEANLKQTETAAEAEVGKTAAVNELSIEQKLAEAEIAMAEDQAKTEGSILAAGATADAKLREIAFSAAVKPEPTKKESGDDA